MIYKILFSLLFGCVGTFFLIATFFVPFPLTFFPLAVVIGMTLIIYGIWDGKFE